MKRQLLLTISFIILLAATGCLGNVSPAAKPAASEAKPAAQQGASQQSESSQAGQTMSTDHIFYVRDGYLRVIKPDGTGHGTLPLDEGQPAVATGRRDPGQAWRSPDKTRVAYLSGRRPSLWVIGIDGSNNQLIAENLLSEKESAKENSRLYRPITQQEMAWSPDSQWLAFFGAPEDHWDLFIANLKPGLSGANVTGDVVRITDDPLKEDALSWSPDSRYLAFKSYSKGDAVGETLIVIKPDGSGRMEIDTSPVVKAAGLRQGTRFNHIGSLHWLDNETFAVFPETSDASMGIWKGKIGSPTVEPILHAQIFGPVWSPEARRWAFVYRDDPATILTISPEGGEPQVIATGEARGPVWSPDGSKIMYSKGPVDAEVWDIYVVDADGSNARAVVQDAPLSQDGQPGPKAKRWWTPNSDGILYVVLGPAVENLWLAKLDGSPPKALTHFEEKEAFYLQPPLWSPDQQMVAFVAFSYTDTNLHLWVADVKEGQVKMIEAGVFWFDWVAVGE